MSKIKNIYAREILDSRGNPTVEVELTLESGIKAVASVPSGASTGKNEALELRDNDKNRYHGKGVLKAINNVNNIIKPLLIGKDSLNQEEIDRIMLEKDGTENKEVLGANAILGVSLANLKAAAKYKGLELYEYLGKEYSMPRCMMNILNGGVHASNNLDFQEFMIVPNKEEYHENLRMGSEVFNTLKNVLKERNLLCGVGDEGGFAPQINDAKEALELIKEAITKSGYELGKDINIALDVAASEFYNEEEDIYLLEGVKYTKEELVSYYQSLVDKYHIISIEDGMAEEDYERRYNAQQKEIKELSAYIAKNKVKTSTARQAASREKKLEKIEVMQKPKSGDIHLNLSFNYSPIGSERFLVVKDLEIGYDFSLLPPIDFEIRSGTKLAITGFNGIGKSTLLKTLVGILKPISGSYHFVDNAKIAYYEQENNFDDPNITPLQEIQNIYPSMTHQEIRSKLARVGLTGNLAIQPIKSMSGGEQSKLKLCKVMMQKANILVLDEPTNHLDKFAREDLLVALKKYNGTVIFVSHERDFVDKLATKVYSIEDLLIN